MLNLLRLLSLSYSEIKAHSLTGRYITNAHIEPLLTQLNPLVFKTEIGHSVNGLPIYKLRFGRGETKIMMWSQMHGNESTTTKALFDFLNFIKKDSFYLDNFSFSLIPILNPDGAKVYTRVNANQVDLNRDARLQSQLETKFLFDEFNQFRPDYCFNLHGQRTIYSVGLKGNSSVLSFLAPAQDENRSVSSNRLKAMTLIGHCYEKMSVRLPNGISLYDDTFNGDCTGDTFQSLGAATLLFEAGHFPGDYQREKTRRFVFEALISVIDAISLDLEDSMVIYKQIPSNAKSYFDVIIRNTPFNDGAIGDIAIQYKEQLVDEAIKFIPTVEKMRLLGNYIGHKEINAHGKQVFTTGDLTLKIGDEIDFVVIENEKILIKP